MSFANVSIYNVILNYASQDKAAKKGLKPSVIDLIRQSSSIDESVTIVRKFLGKTIRIVVSTIL
jgi:hypothetical protein